MPDHEIRAHRSAIDDHSFPHRLPHQGIAQPPALALVQILRKPDGDGFLDGLLDRMEGADAIANAAVHAQVLIHGRVQESHPVRDHLDGPVRTGVSTGGAAAALIPVLNVNHRVYGRFFKDFFNRCIR